MNGEWPETTGRMHRDRPPTFLAKDAWGIREQPKVLRPKGEAGARF